MVIVYEYEYEQIFAEGLGLKSQSKFVFEYSKDIELQGYVKNGDTTGIIWDDNDFVVSIEKNTIADKILIYPTLIPENGVVNIDSKNKFKNIRIYSIDGKPQKFESISQSQIQLLSKKTGVYILTIVVDNKMITRRLIKQ